MSHGFKQTYPRMHLELQRERPKWGKPGFWALSAGLVVAFATVAGYLATRAAITQMETAISREEIVLMAPVEPAVDKETAAVHEGIAGLELPWSGLFMALETATTDGVRLISVAPDAASGNLRIVAQTTSASKMLEYLTALQQQPVIRDLQLTEFAYPESHASASMRFSMDGHWKSTE